MDFGIFVGIVAISLTFVQISLEFSKKNNLEPNNPKDSPNQTIILPEFKSDLLPTSTNEEESLKSPMSCRDNLTDSTLDSSEDEDTETDVFDSQDEDNTAFLKKQEKRLYIMKEFVETEVKYCHQLEILTKFYEEPLKYGKSKNICDSEVAKTIFSDVNLILTINSSFKDKLQLLVNSDGGIDEEELADCLLEQGFLFSFFQNFVNFFVKFCFKKQFPSDITAHSSQIMILQLQKFKRKRERTKNSSNF